jgi:hypothetical protein
VSGPRTLGSRLEDRDRDRFVGRSAELRLLEQCLGDDHPACVALVSGPGGIGKSTLVREFTRRASSHGWQTFTVEGRDLPPNPDALEEALAGARRSPRPLVVLDSYELIGGLDGYLRRDLLPTLPDRTFAVLAGRLAPDPGWFAGGWEGMAVELELGALAARDARQLLSMRGIDADRVPAIVDWADGSPLALALAADAATDDESWSPERVDERPELLRPLIRRLVDAELQGERLSALSVAAIARITTAELLRAVLPETDAEAAYARLRSLSFTEPLGDGLTLHELVRRALRADIRFRESDRERALRRRIVDHLYERALDGEPLIQIEMAHLVENQAIRWGFGWEGASDHRIDDLRPADVGQVTALLAERGLSEWWPLTGRFFADAPERVAVVRDRGDRVCAYLVAMTPANAPPFADENPLVGPWLAHARADAALGEAVLWHDSVDFTGDPRGRVQAMLGMAGILRSGVRNPRYAYLPINPAKRSALAFAQTLGAKPLPELDFALGPHRVACHRIDFGPGGLLAAERAVVYAELGLPPPADAAAPSAAAPPRGRDDPAGVDAVREALRNFHLPHELARSPLAHGASPTERAESVRRLLLGAVEAAFGATENERLLKRVLVRGYLEPTTSHEQVAYELSLSRAAYFRRLRTAAERIADHLRA